MVNCTDMSNTVKSMNTTIRTHGRLYEIWSDGTQFTFVTIVSLVINLFLFFFLYGATEDHPIMRRREKWVTDWGATPKKTTVYHPPANGMVERFNRNLKKVIHAAYPKKKC